MGNLLDMDLQIFAQIDYSMFKQTTVDADQTILKINQVNDYKSL